MKIQEMEMVLEIIDSGSISAAAKKLFISQPSLSQSIKKIEARTGNTAFYPPVWQSDGSDSGGPCLCTGSKADSADL